MGVARENQSEIIVTPWFSGRLAHPEQGVPVGDRGLETSKLKSSELAFSVWKQTLIYTLQHGRKVAIVRETGAVSAGTKADLLYVSYMHTCQATSSPTDTVDMSDGEAYIGYNSARLDHVHTRGTTTATADDTAVFHTTPPLVCMDFRPPSQKRRDLAWRL